MTKSVVKLAAEEHTNLSMFNAVVAILESGGLYGHQRAAQRIIKICKDEMCRCVMAYDRYVAKVGGKDKEV